jgi:hypothetical protein
MSRLHEFKKHIQPGQVYRRAELEQWSNAVDRHLKLLLAEGTLTKLSSGLYYYPKKTVFGEAPADDKALVQAFLKDNRFLITTPNAYNALGVATTQLYNETIVYNHKRHGQFTLGGRTFDFRVKPHFPLVLTEEFLLVDLVNNLERLAEDSVQVLDNVKKKTLVLNADTLLEAARSYGSVRTKKFFSKVLRNNTLRYAV